MLICLKTQNFASAPPSTLIRVAEPSQPPINALAPTDYKNSPIVETSQLGGHEKAARAEDETIVFDIAVEHVLCEKCEASVRASVTLRSQQPSRGSEEFSHYADRRTLKSSGLAPRMAGAGAIACHLCSLILGKIQQQEYHELVASAGPIDVTLQVSRSGGVTLLIQAGEEGQKRRVGELVIVPQDYLESLPQATPQSAGFIFPNQSISIYQNAQLALSLASESSFHLAREWIRQCLQKHTKCADAAQTAIGRPSRLIDVGDDNKRDPKVVVMQYSEAQQLEYLTLSHCWGGASILRLLIENFDSLTSGIPMSTLPKTFQDAITVTRRLGYRYVWIDSLCIIQDCPSDWRTCAASMGEIYAGSVCTIAALTARNAHEGGCFFDYARNPLSFRPCRLLNDWWVEGNSNIGPDLRAGQSPLPLHTRAWVVQERILAPRTLYYGSNGLAWECVERSATEAVPQAEVGRFSPKASFFAIQQHGSDPEKYYDHWMDIQIAYTRCSLTRFGDRLVAISGVIKRLEMLTGWTNVWGLWKERLLLDLLWFLERSTGRPKIEEYLAPTWSWAGVKGRVMVVAGSRVECEWMATVVDVGLLDGGKRGCVRLRGMTREVKYMNTPGWRLNPGIETPAPQWEEVDWDPDVTPEASDINNEMWCVLVARIPGYLGPGTEAMDVGLVVTRPSGEWVRLGVFRQLRRGNTLFQENVG